MNLTKTVMMGAVVVAAATSGCKKQTAPVYPESRKDSITDTYFGTTVADPYRWLEDDTSAETAAWVAAQNEVTFAHLNEIPFRDKLRARLTELINYEKIGTPFKKHGKYYFYKNDGLQNQSVLYVKESLDGEASVLLDPNTLSADGTVALTTISFSNCGHYLAYGISRNGSDWREFYVMELATRTLLDDHIEWAKFSSASWHGNGFYYSAYNSPKAGAELSGVNEGHKIYYHTLGTPQSEDKLVYENKNYPKRFYYSSVDEKEQAMFISESGMALGNDLFMRDLRKPNAPIVRMTNNYEFDYSPQVVDGKIYIYTNWNAPKYKVMVTELDKPESQHWVDFISETENVLSDIAFIGGKVVTTYMKDASDHAYVCNMQGERLHEVTLPTLGSVGFSGTFDDQETFYSFTSFTFPNTIYKYDLTANASERYLAPNVKFNADDFETVQTFFTSKDGTQVPMFLTYKKGLKRNGNNPVYLYGYGGFNISLTPSFSAMRIPFLENGGIYALVTLRGGGEYGKEWYEAGTQQNKQNVFDDFIGAAEYLIAEKYTTPKRIAIAGGSNGGLLVGACVNQRPDLYAAALPAVGVMDMLRYHLFTIGWNWAPDYGRSDDSKEMFEYLYGYSPLHNVRNDGTPYPAIMVTTADHDDRVVPAHSFKYAAALQAANTGDAPKLIRIETNAGHGAGKPISKTIDEQTDMYAFVMYHMGMKPKF